MIVVDTGPEAQAAKVHLLRTLFVSVIVPASSPEIIAHTERCRLPFGRIWTSESFLQLLSWDQLFAITRRDRFYFVEVDSLTLEAGLYGWIKATLIVLEITPSVELRGILIWARNC